MYTGMHGVCLENDYIQQCRLVWWTVYVLERRMSSLLGVPFRISEESISVSLPANSRQFPNSNALKMQVTLCQILAKIDLSESPNLLPTRFAKLYLAVYGNEGKIDRRYISATQAVLRDIAKITEQLNTSFDLYENASTRGISRISAHLHLLGHQVWIIKEPMWLHEKLTLLLSVLF
jgi:hypothetical protein